MRTTALSLLTLALLFVAAPAAWAQSSSPSDTEKATKYSLYYEDFKNENYASALPNLRWILTNAPTYPKNDDRNYERAAELYAGLAEQAEDEAKKKAYLDSTLAIYDRAVPELKEAGAEVNEYSWTLQKGRFIQNHTEAFPEKRNQVAEMYRTAYDQNPMEIDPFYIDYVLRSYLPDEKEKAVTLLDDVMAKRSDEQKVQELDKEFRSRIFTSPQEKIAYLTKQVDTQACEPIEQVAELFQLYMRTEQRGEASALGECLQNMEDPSPTALRALARMSLDDGAAQEAFDLYERASSMEGAEPAAQDFYNMGIAKQQMGQPSQARTHFRRALEVDSGFGQAYIGIGDLYASAVSNCSGEMEIDDRAVYWLATDYYQRAKSADGALSSVANQKIGQYRQYFPDSEALFFKGWEAGQSYSVNSGCYAWISESTTVKKP